ncbi:M20 metallopeptidase family protein [Mariniphaga sediminis]|uniref:M20 metallopeptidase family protein n=1 Tax=Mariniphaga sediminis TaxID=1628158 RepID=UPI003565F084
MNLKLFLIGIAIIIQIDAMPQIREKIEKETQKQIGYALELCKYLHQNPELSFQEFETAKRMASELHKAGFEVTENFGGNNVVGILKNGNGPVVMLRTDMDALPIEEKTGLEFASTKTSQTTDGKEVPVMHACGHDIHMSVWAGTIHTLAALKEHWKGTLLVIAQQAEEYSGGADKAINEGLFSRFPTPDYALAYHINPSLESGTIGLIGGPVFAGVKTAEITVFGKGGHGAYPEKCIDPVVIASRIVMDLQTIVSREISPLEPAVVTVGSIHGGTRPNIIPDEVKMELTLRYYSDEVIKKVIAAIKRISHSAAQMAGMPEDQLPFVHIYEKETPPVINDEKLSQKTFQFATEIIGSENIQETPPAMVGEDFGKYGRTPENVPICLIWLGSTEPALMKQLKAEGKEPYPLHSPRLNPDYKKTIETGIKVMAGNVIGLMREK